MTTVYKIAHTSLDYANAFALLRDEGVTGEQISFPTILALEDGKAVGILGTRVENKMVIAGPLVLRSDKRRSFTAMRLFEYYEHSMKGMGITSYIFNTESGHIFDKVIREKLELEPYASEGGRNFYIRKLSNGNESQSAGAERRGDAAPAEAS